MLFKNEETSLKLDIVNYEFPADGGDPTSDDRNWLVLRATWVDDEGREIGIMATPPIFAFIGRIQEETHRFAIEFHRERRSKQMRKSQLDDIEGLGPARRKKLLDRFGTIKAIKAADIEDIAAVVPRAVAENIKRKLGE